MTTQSTTWKAEQSFLIVSNRGPLEFSTNSDGIWSSRRASGGMVSSLINLSHYLPSSWIALAISADDRAAALRQEQGDPSVTSLFQLGDVRLRYVTIAPQSLQQHYEVISNRVLWFLIHYIYDGTHPPVDEQQLLAAWTNGYVIANRAIAKAVLDEIRTNAKPPIVMINDYSLYLVSSFVREVNPDAFIYQFLHCPWPEVRYWLYLPSGIVTDIFSGLLGNDLLGFQTSLDAHNFLLGMPLILPECTVNMEAMTVSYHNHTTHLGVYPIGTVPEQDRQDSRSPITFPELDQLNKARQSNQSIVMRIDRIDPSKQIVQGFQAFAQLLEVHPELRENIVFFAFLVPTREMLPAYAAYRQEVENTITRINSRFGTQGWQPIVSFVQKERSLVLAALQEFDVLLVNSAADGMNLVVKEAITVNRRNGVIVLSRTVGAYQQLYDVVLPIAPYSVSGTANALYQALTMPSTVREDWHTMGISIIESSTMQQWFERQSVDIQRIIANKQR